MALRAILCQWICMCWVSAQAFAVHERRAKAYNRLRVSACSCRPASSEPVFRSRVILHGVFPSLCSGSGP